MRTLGIRLVAATLVAGLLGATGCGDSAVGNNQNDAEVTLPDAGIDGDALVDQGPLDCGVRPADGSICVQGRLYDFETNQPAVGGIEQEVLSISNFWGPGGFRAAKENPSSFRGRIAPNGRFFTWTNDHEEDSCLVTFEPTPSYRPDTVNCYPHHFALHDAGAEYRLFLVAETTFAAWILDYPGEADLATDRPVFLGQCLDESWEPLHSGEMSFSPSVHSPLNWPSRETYPFADVRSGFLDAPIGYPYPMPNSGAMLAYVPGTNADGDQVAEMNADLACDTLGDNAVSVWIQENSFYDAELDLVILSSVRITTPSWKKFSPKGGRR